MEQIVVNFTDKGSPKTGLTPTIKIMGRDGTVFVNDGTCNELGYGWYSYNFGKYDSDKTYLYVFDGGASLSDYDRYKFGGNDFDAYANKYSWGRTAAPYFTTYGNQLSSLQTSVKKIKPYNDSEIKKSLDSITKSIREHKEIGQLLKDIKKTISNVQIDMSYNSSSADTRRGEISDRINEKLDLVAQYVYQSTQDMSNTLSNLDNDITTRIEESNTNLNEGLSTRVTIEQLLQQVERIENKLEEVIQSNLKGDMPNDLLDKYDVSMTRKKLSDEELMNRIGMNPMGQMSQMSQPNEMSQPGQVNQPSPLELGTPREQTMNPEEATLRGPKTNNIMPL